MPALGAHLTIPPLYKSPTSNRSIQTIRLWMEWETDVTQKEVHLDFSRQWA